MIFVPCSLITMPFPVIADGTCAVLFFFVILGNDFLQELVIWVSLFPNFWMN